MTRPTTLPNPSTPMWPSAPRSTANPAPPRRAGSVRRTSSIDVEWLEGIDGTRILHGRARDYATPLHGDARTIAAARMEATMAPDRSITAINATPAPARLDELVGQRGGRHLRVTMAQIMPELIASGAPLYLPLDDISGTSLICVWAWSLWDQDWLGGARLRMGPEEFDAMMSQRANVCWGLQTGNSGLSSAGGHADIGAADAGDLVNPADPDGWHGFPVIPNASFRRARRIDVWREAGLLHIDSAFQDSAARPGGGRAALHEYRLTAIADPVSQVLLSLDPEPRVLPFRECPGAVDNARGLIGTPLTEIRTNVLAQLRGPAGCTHLNDALRALAEVPVLAAHLECLS